MTRVSVISPRWHDRADYAPLVSGNPAGKPHQEEPSVTYLEHINGPEDLKGLTQEQLAILASRDP